MKSQVKLGQESSWVPYPEIDSIKTFTGKAIENRHLLSVFNVSFNISLIYWAKQIIFLVILVLYTKVLKSILSSISWHQLSSDLSSW